MNGRISKTVKRHYSGSNKNAVGTISGEMRVLNTRVMAAEVTAELTTSPPGIEDIERNTVARESLAVNGAIVRDCRSSKRCS